jgi:hypothetical protein
MMGSHGFGLMRGKYKVCDNMQGFREIFYALFKSLKSRWYLFAIFGGCALCTSSFKCSNVLPIAYRDVLWFNCSA